jgi:hypothetical protein
MGRVGCITPTAPKKKVTVPMAVIAVRRRKTANQTQR